jgi:tetrahydromethanopterin S-methyltransferase subunit G
MTFSGDRILFEYRHTLQQFHSAVASLATGPGDVRSRLRCVWLGSLMNVKLEYLPESLQNEFTYIHKRLHRMNEPVEVTLGRIRNATGAKIALSIFNIYESLTDMYSIHEKRQKSITRSLSDILPFDLSKYKENIDK